MAQEHCHRGPRCIRPSAHKKPEAYAASGLELRMAGQRRPWLRKTGPGLLEDLQRRSALDPDAGGVELVDLADQPADFGLVAGLVGYGRQMVAGLGTSRIEQTGVGGNRLQGGLAGGLVAAVELAEGPAEAGTTKHGRHL